MFISSPYKLQGLFYTSNNHGYNIIYYDKMQQQDEKTKKLAVIFGKSLRTLRNNADKSLDNFANAYGFSKSTLSTIENGTFNVKYVTAWKLAEALGVKLSELTKMIEDELGDDFRFIDE